MCIRDSASVEVCILRVLLLTNWYYKTQVLHCTVTHHSIIDSTDNTDITTLIMIIMWLPCMQSSSDKQWAVTSHGRINQWDSQHSPFVHKQGAINLRNDKSLITTLNLSNLHVTFSSLWRKRPIAVNFTHSIRQHIRNATVSPAVKDKHSLVPYMHRIILHHFKKFKKPPFISVVNQFK